MDVEVIIQEIGEFGRFQLQNYILVCLPVFYAAANSLTYVFTSRSTKYRCLVPECESANNTKYSKDWVKDILPGSISDSSVFVPDECLKYKFIANTSDSSLENETCQAHWFDHEKVRCYEWVFDGAETAIVNDWPDELACKENKWKLALVGSVHYAGIIVGTALFGFLADHYGRKKMFIVSIILMSITGFGHGLASTYIWFLFYGFLNAIATAGVYPLAFVLGVEMVGKNKREMAGVVLNYFYSIGEALVGIIAWIDGDWRNLQYWVSIPPILFIFYYWIIPESIRWLIANEAYSKAFEIVKKASKENNRELSGKLLEQFEEKCFKKENPEPNADDERHKSIELATYGKFLRSKILMIRSLCLCFIWGTNAFVFYGLSLNSINLSGNIFLNFVLGCLIEIPGNTISWITMNKFGRRRSLAASLLICGICCISGGFVDTNSAWIQMCLFLLGKMAITTSFTIIFVYTAEMMPTTVRGGCLGTFSTMSRFASLVAPFIPLLKSIYSFLPLVVFGLFAFISGFLSFLLPETLGSKLPDTIAEAENIESRENISNTSDITRL
ncbi:organic cation transporter protein-like [Chironomus tepperi]|uniref:organic cation transporter protein-like n=1 Tax=Chironomus tepperi TaxID=113505 RepID=UPI00391EFEEA